MKKIWTYRGDDLVAGTLKIRENFFPGPSRTLKDYTLYDGDKIIASGTFEEVKKIADDLDI